MRCHCIPVIKTDNEYMFLLNQTYGKKQWGGFSEEHGFEESYFKTAVKSAFDKTFGIIGIWSQLMKSEILNVVIRKDNYYCFLIVDMTFDNCDAINRVINYTRKSVVSDDIVATRWFYLDEICSFKDVSSDLILVLLEDSHKFRNGPHLLDQ